MSKKNSISLTIDDTVLKRKLAKLKDVQRSGAISKGLWAGALFLCGHIKLNIDKNFTRRTGNMIGSVQPEDPIVQNDFAYILFGTHVVYGAIHEFGGVINATHAPFLVFKNQEGDWIHTKSVTMPARPFIRPAITEHGNEAIETVGNVIGAEIQRMWDNGS